MNTATLLEQLRQPFPPDAISYGYCRCGCGGKPGIASVTRRKYGWVKGQPLPYIQGHNRNWHSTPEAAFWSYVTPGASDECWPWLGSTAGAGYGRARIAGKKPILAHRLSYILHYGEITDDLWVLHKCDIPICVNPKHLFLGTHQDNTDDKVRKGRHPRGEQSSQAKLTWDKVRTIRSLHFVDRHSIRGLGRQFGVSEATIRFIVRGETWKEVQS